MHLLHYIYIPFSNSTYVPHAMHYYHANSHSLATHLFTPYSCSFMGIKSAISVSLVFNFTDEGPGLEMSGI